MPEEKEPEKEDKPQESTEPTPTPEVKPEAAPKGKKGGRFFNRIPKDFLISPGGVVLVFVAVIFEISDLLIPGGSLTLEIIPDLIFAFLLSAIARVPLLSSIIPFVVERIPVISDILPTWIIRMFL